MIFARWRVPLTFVTLFVTAVSLWLSSTRLSLSPDLSALFPDRGDAAALARFTRAFGGGDVALALVTTQGASAAPRVPDDVDDADVVDRAAARLAERLRGSPTVTAVLSEAPAFDAPADPTAAWLHAGPRAREALARAVTNEGMRERLAETKRLLLAPGSGDVESLVVRDPLRLYAIPFEARHELAAGLRAGPGGGFVTDDGRARLLVIEPKGSPFVSRDAGAFVRDAEAAIMEVTQGEPRVRIALTGGHAIAHATERMVRRDLTWSSTLSTVLASLAFLLTFRRARALLAVLPPLALGTLWTLGAAALLPHGLSAIATAFAAVVVGVGVDTGVHVYAALLEGRRMGLSPDEAAQFARRTTARPALLAALAAGLAFLALAQSELEALRQLGILCGVGEMATALAIVLMTPAIGARLERGAPPAKVRSRLLGLIAHAASTRRGATLMLSFASVPVLLVAFVGLPQTGDALVAIRPRALSPIQAQEEVYRLFGGGPGQWVVLSVAKDADVARARADAVAEALEPLTEAGIGFDALATFLPARATQAMRRDARARLDLPGRAHMLEDVLREEGFAVSAFEPALEAFRASASSGVPAMPDAPAVPDAPDGEAFAEAHPAETPGAFANSEAKGGSDARRMALRWVLRRHVATDEGDTLVATFVRPTGDPDRDARALSAIRAADPQATITGYAHLERALRERLAIELPKVALVALLVVALTLRAALGRMRDVLLAIGTLVVELAMLALFMRVFGVRLHVYDALIIPVLIGITMDEAMFMLHAARGAPDGHAAALRALEHEGPLVIATALTTAAGFAALLVCRFDGLFDVGAVGVLGTLVGLIAALVVVPAGLALAGSERKARAAAVP